MDQVGSLERLYREYGDLADFRLIYTAEAHPADGQLPFPEAVEKDIRQHKSYADRCEMAQKLVNERQLTIPALVDHMDNAVTKAYKAYPLRLCLIGLDGRVALTTEVGPKDLGTVVKQVATWLQQHESARARQSRP